MLLRLENIEKSYHLPGSRARIQANCGISLSLDRGAVHAIAGENGAGKSTLVSILYGETEPDAGTIFWDDCPVRIPTPRAALALGIGMVHQHFQLIESFTVLENVFLGNAPRTDAVFFDKKKARAELCEAATRFSLPVASDEMVGNLGAAEKQRVVLLRALLRGGKLLILDEPSALLDAAETRNLYCVIRSLADAGLAVLLITHTIAEALDAADNITVLRKGSIAGTVRARETNEASIHTLMFGAAIHRDTIQSDTIHGNTIQHSNILHNTIHGNTMYGNNTPLEVRGVTTEHVRALSFRLERGEMRARPETGEAMRSLVAVITGRKKPLAGEVYINGTNCTGRGIRTARNAGLAYVSGDRRRGSLAPGLSVTENLLLSSYHSPPLSRWTFFSKSSIINWRERVFADAPFLRRHPEMSVDALSGGNQQQLVLLREVAAEQKAVQKQPPVLVAVNPFRGLDAAALERVRSLLRKAAESGTAVLLFGKGNTDLCHRA